MATAKDYFTQSQHMQLGHVVTLNVNGVSHETSVQVVQDFEGGSKYIKIFLPECEEPDFLLAYILNNAAELIWKLEADVHIEVGFVGTAERVIASELAFSGRVLVYTPSIIPEKRWQKLSDQMMKDGLSLLVRDGIYAQKRSEHETPLAFISHDSRDKDAFVSELANQLSKNLCPVWYDEYRLKPGDNLREQIEGGLKTCPRCIIVLSKNFFSNPGWTKKEFETIYTREIIKGENVIIPIWLDVTKEDVYDYSPALLNTMGIQASLGAVEVANRLVGVLKAAPSAHEK